MTEAAPRPVDFTLVVDSAVRAFGSDVSYAVAIISAAVSIRKKRSSWELRRELRQAEKAARELCSDASPFSCHTLSPCGTATCKFAQGDLTLVKASHCPGSTPRVQQNAIGGNYSVEAAIEPLTLLRQRPER